MFLQQKYIAKYHFFQNVFMIIFLHIFMKNEKKQERCIILMYCLYESINKHNADIDFFVHALAMF